MLMSVEKNELYKIDTDEIIDMVANNSKLLSKELMY